MLRSLFLVLTNSIIFFQSTSATHFQTKYLVLYFNNMIAEFFKNNPVLLHLSLSNTGIVIMADSVFNIQRPDFPNQIFKNTNVFIAIAK